MGLIFTYLMTYGGACVSLFNPFVGLLIYVAFSILRPEALWHWSVPAGNYSRIIALSLLVGWAINGFGDWRFGRATAIVFCLVGFLGWGMLSATQALLPEKSWFQLEGLAKIVIPFVVGLSLVDSVQKLKQLAWVILLSQGFVAYELNLSYLNGFNIVQEQGFGGMDNNCVAITLVTTSGLAFFLGLSTKRFLPRVLAFGAAAVMIHGVLITFSRGGVLGLILVATVSFLLIPKRFKHYLIFALVIGTSLFFTGPELADRFSSSFASEQNRDYSAQSRIELWGICAKIMQDRPLLGLGPAHFGVHAHEFGLTKGKQAHSTWFQVGAETGVVGLALLLSFYLICIKRLWPLTKERNWVPDPWLRDMSRMVIASLAGFLFTAQFVTLEGLESPYYIALIGAGALKLLSNAPIDDMAESLDLP